MKDPAIKVSYRPFTLELRRTNDGEIVANLTHQADTAPLVHSKTSYDYEHRAWIRTDTPVPCLQIGTARFNVPKRQLARVEAWLGGDAQPVLDAPLTTASTATAILVPPTEPCTAVQQAAQADQAGGE
jgi:hypothetical protein